MRDYNYIKSIYRNMLRSEIRRIIAGACGTQGQNFKQKVPLSELINYKISNENQKFQYYVSAIEEIVLTVKCLFPFINLEGIDMNWTTEQIINTVFEIYDKVPVANFTEKI